MAIVPSTSGSVIYVVKPDGTVDVRNVTAAGANGDMTGLASGVAAGEHVVVEGQFNLTKGQRVARRTSRPPAPISPADRRHGDNNLSRFFIRRPVATILLAIGVFVAGLFAVGLLPVASLPEVDYPTISVSAHFPARRRRPWRTRSRRR